MPGSRALVPPATPITWLIAVKLLLLAATVAPARQARPGLIPRLDNDTLVPLAWHIRTITTLAIAFVVVGEGLRPGGFG